MLLLRLLAVLAGIGICGSVFAYFFTRDARYLALAWRLFNLKLIGDDTRQSLAQEKQRPSVSGSPKRFSPSFVKMLYEALDNGRLSARKAAKAIGLGLGGLTELFGQYDLPAPFEL